MIGLQIARVGTHKMRKLKGDAFLHADLRGGLQFQEQFFPFDRQELDGHIAIKSFAIGPAV